MGIYMRLFAGLGRSLVSLIFIVTAVSHILDWEQADRDLAYALANWELYSSDMPLVNDLFTTMVSWGPALIGTAIGLQLVGGLLLFFNIRVRAAAFLLLIYLLFATIVYQPFWFLEGRAYSRSLLLFLNHLAILGGLLVILGTGKGIRKIVTVKPKSPKRSKKEEDRDEFDED